MSDFISYSHTLLKIYASVKKFNVDSQHRFCFQIQSFLLISAPICMATAKIDTQFQIFA